MTMAIEHQDSSLLLCFPRRFCFTLFARTIVAGGSIDRYMALLWLMLKLAIEQKAFYIVHILLTRFEPANVRFDLQSLFKLDDRSNSVNTVVDLFIYNHVLKHTAVTFYYERDLLKHVLSRQEQFFND